MPCELGRDPGVRKPHDPASVFDSAPESTAPSDNVSSALSLPRLAVPESRVLNAEVTEIVRQRASSAKSIGPGTLKYTVPLRRVKHSRRVPAVGHQSKAAALILGETTVMTKAPSTLRKARLARVAWASASGARDRSSC